MAEDSQHPSSFGLKLVDILIKQLKGSMQVLVSEGVTYHIEFDS